MPRTATSGSASNWNTRTACSDLTGGEIFEKDAAGFAVIVWEHRTEFGGLLGFGALIGEGDGHGLEGHLADFDQFGAIAFIRIDHLVGVSQ